MIVATSSMSLAISILLTEVVWSYVGEPRGLQKDTSLLDNIHPCMVWRPQVEQTHCGDVPNAGGEQNDILEHGHRPFPWYLTELHRLLMAQCTEMLNIVLPQSSCQLPLILMSSRSPLLNRLSEWGHQCMEHYQLYRTMNLCPRVVKYWTSGWREYKEWYPEPVRQITMDLVKRVWLMQSHTFRKVSPCLVNRVCGLLNTANVRRRHVHAYGR